MTTGLALTDLSGNYKRALIATPVLGGTGLLVSSVLGYWIAGVLFCVGLALGLVNISLMLRATARFSASDDPSKRPIILGTLRRLAIITALALPLAIYFQPEGIAVVFGLAVFQLLTVAGMSGPILREVRKG